MPLSLHLQTPLVPSTHFCGSAWVLPILLLGILGGCIQALDPLLRDDTFASYFESAFGDAGLFRDRAKSDLEDGWFLEPYAQFAALRVNGDDYELDNGMQASSNHANSLLGKLGSSFGKRIPLASGGFAEPYLKLAVAHEFADNNLVRVNGDRFNNDLSGTRGEIGGGVAAQVSEKLQLHLDLDYSKGKNVEQPYGVNLGLRYNF